MDMDESIQSCLDYIDAHLDERLTPENLAARFHYSESHLRRSFLAHMGISVTRYIRIARTARAARDIMNNVPVKAAVVTYRYKTSSGFARAFERIYGVPPTSYREETAWGLPVIEFFAPLTLACYVLRTAEDGMGGLALWHGWDFSAVGVRDFSQAAPDGGAEIGMWTELDGKRCYLFGVVCAKDAKIPEGMLRYTLPPAAYAMFSVEASEDTAQLWENVNAALDVSLQCCDDAKTYARSDLPCLEYYDKSNVYLCVPVRICTENGG